MSAIRGFVEFRSPGQSRAERACMVNIVVNAAAKLSKVDTRPFGEFSATV
jgi:hypothetical protein